jgi:hypothetical protein
MADLAENGSDVKTSKINFHKLKIDDLNKC